MVCASLLLPPRFEKSMIMAVNFASDSSPQKLINVSWLRGLPLLLLSAMLASTLASSSPSSPSPISYADHCSSTVPESTPTVPDYSDFAIPQAQGGYYHGGRGVFDQQNSSYSYPLWLHTPTVFRTNAVGVFKIQGTLKLVGSTSLSNSSRWPGSLSFSLRGYWSESSGRVCMVGSAQTKSSDGSSLPDLEAVLKLQFPRDSNVSTSVVTGSLESPKNSDKGFDPISILMFPPANYTYTLGSENSDDESDRRDPDVGPSLGIRHGGGSLCAMFTREMNGRLEYSKGCKTRRKCNPFLEDATHSLPGAMSMSSIQCSEEQKRLRVLVEFPREFVGYDRPFDPNTALVGEGSWDSERNRLSIVACRILDATSSLANARVGDCSFRMRLRLPAILSLEATSSIIGRIWTKKTASEAGYFQPIAYRSLPDGVTAISGTRYRYTKSDRVKKSCPAAQGPPGNRREGYPKADSYDMSFDASVKNSRGRIAWGNAFPFFVNDEFHTGNFYGSASSVSNDSHSSPVNISYKMSFTSFSHLELGSEPTFFNSSFSFYGRVEMSAEGIYDPGTGRLCMVACRSLDSNTQISRNASMDCEILVDIQFPPLHAVKRGAVKGKIESTRKEHDPLYFDRVDVSGSSYYITDAAASIWRMDLEIAMVLISETFVCVFIGVQIYHAKKHPDVLPSTSLLMLVILTLGHMIPLLLNFEALFFGRRTWHKYWFRSQGRLEFDEVAVRVVSMVAFIMQFRLLQLSWSDRLRRENQKDLWVAEKKTLSLCVFLYCAGAVAALFKHVTGLEQGRSVLRELKSYGGLVLDGFLLPQILLNVFADPTGKTKERTLSRTFYIGTTFARLVPHAYDLYRARGYNSLDGEFSDDYIYANPGADFYSPVWDVIIPCGCLLFALIVHLQQRYGGRCILPRRLRMSEAAYEKVPPSEVAAGEA